ncbi:hypothetical protein DUI87_23818 [Hirundo rustica rustica]|uniref:Reverse transcriptase domain-containing protein n=1 Tax=Hirundo rustica rustica TaxID=333673 RepID=A0A3M0JEV8_HIRRU|nr:hypothetical protein DUI87_23818 [Hirundo rustica rustica]
MATEANYPLGLVDGVREQNSLPVIQEEAVSDLLSHSDAHNSVGLDGIHPRVVRELAEELAIVYYQSWLTGEVPEEWKLANVTPIHKSGWKGDLGSYRSVTLTSVPSKVMEQIILSAIKQQTYSMAKGSGPASMDLGGVGTAWPTWSPFMTR